MLRNGISEFFGSGKLRRYTRCSNITL
ncbi:hypothetical protein, partial [Timonella senegalensis]